jgi:phage anti-repressor protein
MDITNNMLTLDDYLHNIFETTEMYTSDDMGDQYDAWVESLDADEVMQFAEEFIAIIHYTHKEKIQNAVKDLTGYKMPL